MSAGAVYTYLMSTTAKTKAPREAQDLIVEFLLYRWDKRFITSDVLREQTGLTGFELSNAVRQLVTSSQALRYSRRGEYEILDLERYFDQPEPGAHQRWCEDHNL